MLSNFVWALLAATAHARYDYRVLDREREADMIASLEAEISSGLSNAALITNTGDIFVTSGPPEIGFAAVSSLTYNPRSVTTSTILDTYLAVCPEDYPATAPSGATMVCEMVRTAQIVLPISFAGQAYLDKNVVWTHEQALPTVTILAPSLTSSRSASSLAISFLAPTSNGHPASTASSTVPSSSSSVISTSSGSSSSVSQSSESSATRGPLPTSPSSASASSITETSSSSSAESSAQTSSAEAGRTSSSLASLDGTESTEDPNSSAETPTPSPQPSNPLPPQDSTPEPASQQPAPDRRCSFDDRPWDDFGDVTEIEEDLLWGDHINRFGDRHDCIGLDEDGNWEYIDCPPAPEREPARHESCDCREASVHRHKEDASRVEETPPCLPLDENGNREYCTDSREQSLDDCFGQSELDVDRDLHDRHQSYHAEYEPDPEDQYEQYSDRDYSGKEDGEWC